MENRRRSTAYLAVLVGLTALCGAAFSAYDQPFVTDATHRASSVRSPRQTGSGSTGTEPASSLSPWSLSYWFGAANVNEAVAVLFPGMNWEPPVCRTTDDDIFKAGLCTRLADCPYYNGEGYGGCGMGFGTCCVFAYYCTGTTDLVVSQFVSRTFTTTDPGTGECKLTVNPRHNNICQYRLDFESFNIAQPDLSSDCTQDFFGVTGGSSVPKICGDMTGQHMYVNVEPGGGPIILTMDTSKTLYMKRDWNIKITQIDCDSPFRAPSGCLQFYNETSGMVKSFNFKGIDPPDEDDGASRRRVPPPRRASPQRKVAQKKNQTLTTTNTTSSIPSSSIILTKDEIEKLKNETLVKQSISNMERFDRNDRKPRKLKKVLTDMRQIQQLNYGVCINAKVGYCDLTWTQSKAHGQYSFTMSGDATKPSEELASEFGVENCVTDYVTIPGGRFVDDSGAEIHAVRYCGTKFPEVKTKSQPYLLQVVTDVDEAVDKRNLGFALNFRQNLC